MRQRQERSRAGGGERKSVLVRPAEPTGRVNRPSQLAGSTRRVNWPVRLLVCSRDSCAGITLSAHLRAWN